MSNLPPDWSTAELRRAASAAPNSFIDGDWIEAPYITNQGIRLIQTGNIGRASFIDKGDTQKYISRASFRLLNCKWVNAGDLLICRLADPIGRACEIPVSVGEAITSVDCTIFRVEASRFDKRFVLHWLNSAENLKNASDKAAGSTRFRISRSNLGKLPIPEPDLNEQGLIAQVLDTLDTAIHETEAIIAKLKAVKQGMLHDLLTRGIDANGELRPPQVEAPHLYKESPLGWIPKEWVVLPFGSRVAVIDPNPSHRYPREQESGIPICSTENFDGEDDFLLEQSKKMPFSVFDFQNSRCDFADNQVIFARKGRIGLARRYGQERKVFSHTVVVLTRISELTNQDWLLWLARSSAFLNGIRVKMNSNSGVPTLGIELIKSVMTAFPPAFEQAHIARMLDSSSSRIRQEEQGLAALKSVRCGLMEDLLTGRVRVTPLLAEAEQQAGSA